MRRRNLRNSDADLEFCTKWTKCTTASELGELISSLAPTDEHICLEYAQDRGYLIDVLDDEGNTILHKVFLQHGRNAIFRDTGILKIDSVFFMCKENKNYTNNQGLSHLHIACALGYLCVVNILVGNGADVNARCQSIILDETICNNYTALHFAAKFQRTDVVLYLLQNGADVASTDNCSSPLHVACEHYNLFKNVFIDNMSSDFNKIMTMLLKHGNPINATDENGITPIMSVFEKNVWKYHCFNAGLSDPCFAFENILVVYRKILNDRFNYILEAGALLEAKTSSGSTILDLVLDNLWLAHSSNANINMFYDDRIIADVVETLLILGVATDGVCDTGLNYLETVVSCLSFDVAERLLNRGFNVKNLSFDKACLENNGKFFVYSDEIPPSLRVVENLLDLLELLSKKGWIMSRKDCLVVVKFLVWSADKCHMNQKILRSYEIRKVQKILDYGTPAAIQRVYNNSKEDFERYPNGKFTIKPIEFSRYACIRRNYNFYMDEETKQIVQAHNTRADHSYKLREEVIEMRAIKLNGKLSLFDALTMHPHVIYKYLENKEYRKITRADTFETKFFKTCHIIRGHFTRSLVRRCISEQSRLFVKPVIFPNISDVCFYKILDHLENEDILNLCVAVLGGRIIAGK